MHGSLKLIMIKLNPIFFPSSKSLVVFGRNKLNGTDAIMPLLLELAEKKNKKIIFCVANFNLAYKSIKKNVLFNDILVQYGSLNLLGGISKVKVLRYFIWVLQLSLIFSQGIAGAKIIHYGELNKFPFKLLRIAFRKRVFLIENNTNETYYGKAIEEIGRIKIGKIKKFKKSYLFDENCLDDRIIYRKSTMKLYDEKSEYKFFYFGRSRSRSFWLNYIADNKIKYFEKYNPKVASMKCVVIIGTWYHGCFYNNVSDVFEKMLDSFQERFADQYFLFKPHPLSDISYVEKEFEKRNLKYEITFLHPNLLALQAKVFIGNNFSNMMTDGALMKIPIIEFSNYIDELLEITGGKSTSSKFVDYFIDNDVNEFVDSLNNIISNPSKFDNILTSLKIDEPEAAKVINLLE